MTDTNTATAEAPKSYAQKISDYNKLCDELKGFDQKKQERDSLQAELQKLASDDFPTYSAAMMEAAKLSLATKLKGSPKSGRSEAKPKKQVKLAIWALLEKGDAVSFSKKLKTDTDGTQAGSLFGAILKAWKEAKYVEKDGTAANTTWKVTAKGKTGIPKDIEATSASAT